MKKIVVTFYNGKSLEYSMKNKSDHMQYYNKYKREADTIVLIQNGITTKLKK